MAQKMTALCMPVRDNTNDLLQEFVNCMVASFKLIQYLFSCTADKTKTITSIQEAMDAYRKLPLTIYHQATMTEQLYLNIYAMLLLGVIVGKFSTTQE